MNKQRLLVEIDVLNDTRLGCIALHKPEAIITIMDNGYWDRISDDFESLSEGMVTNEEFAAWYKDRTWKALKQSTITNGVHVVGQMLLELQRKKLEGVTVGDIVLTVNMWPYDLAPNVCEAIVGALQTKMPINIELGWVMLSPEELSPSRIEKICDGLVMYNFDEWYSINGPKLLKKQIPDITFYVPQLLKPGVTKDDPAFNGLHGTVDPFKYMRISEYGKYIIEFLPPAVFSVATPSLLGQLS